MWSFLTITSCITVIALTVHDCYIEYLKKRYDQETRRHKSSSK